MFVLKTAKVGEGASVCVASVCSVCVWVGGGGGAGGCTVLLYSALKKQLKTL